MDNFQSVLSSPSLGDSSQTLRTPDIVSQTPLFETTHAQPAISSGTMRIPDIVSQTPLFETVHAQVPIVFDYSA